MSSTTTSKPCDNIAHSSLFVIKSHGGRSGVLCYGSRPFVFVPSPSSSQLRSFFLSATYTDLGLSLFFLALTFAFVYSSTTSYFPKAVFVLAFTVLSLAFLSFSRIRLDKPARTLEEQAILDSERIPLVRSSQDEQGLL